MADASGVKIGDNLATFSPMHTKVLSGTELNAGFQVLVVAGDMPFSAGQCIAVQKPEIAPAGFEPATKRL